jgi:hypothetical protein
VFRYGSEDSTDGRRAAVESRAMFFFEWMKQAVSVIGAVWYVVKQRKNRGLQVEETREYGNDSEECGVSCLCTVRMSMDLSPARRN